MFKNHLFLALCLYFVLTSIFMLIWRKINKNKYLKFGLGSSKTLLPLWFFIIINRDSCLYLYEVD